MFRFYKRDKSSRMYRHEPLSTKEHWSRTLSQKSLSGVPCLKRISVPERCMKMGNEMMLPYTYPSSDLLWVYLEVPNKPKFQRLIEFISSMISQLLWHTKNRKDRSQQGKQGQNSIPLRIACPYGTARMQNKISSSPQSKYVHMVSCFYDHRNITNYPT